MGGGFVYPWKSGDSELEATFIFRFQPLNLWEGNPELVVVGSLGTHVSETFIFSGYNPYISGPKTFIFPSVLGGLQVVKDFYPRNPGCKGISGQRCVESINLRWSGKTVRETKKSWPHIGHWEILELFFSHI